MQGTFCRSVVPAGQWLACFTRWRVELRRVVAFPHFERAGVWGNGREGGAVEEDQLDVRLKEPTSRDPVLAGCG